MNIQNKDLGVFEVKSGKVVVSDPCYEVDGRLQEILENVAVGNWIAEVNQSDEGDWGIRNAELIAYHKASGEPRGWEWSFQSDKIAVDSGQAGFYDADTYRNDAIVDGETADFGANYDKDDGDVWYRYNCYQTLESKDSAGVINGGVVSSSGFGDGCYKLYVAINDGMIVGLKVSFMGDVCDYCEEYEDSCTCTYCDDCGYREEECDCEFCDECGENTDYCQCDDEEDED